MSQSGVNRFLYVDARCSGGNTIRGAHLSIFLLAMDFKNSKEKLERMIIKKSKEELTLFLRESSKHPLLLNSNLGETSLYNLCFDYDQFIITEQAKPLRNNGILEINGFLKISKIDEKHSKLEYSIRYTDLTKLIIVAMNLFVILGPILVSNFRFFGNITKITTAPGKIAIILVLLVLTNLAIIVSFQMKKGDIQKIVDQIVNSIKSDEHNE
jgi:hypothetical protein